MACLGAPSYSHLVLVILGIGSAQYNEIPIGCYPGRNRQPVLVVEDEVFNMNSKRISSQFPMDLLIPDEPSGVDGHADDFALKGGLFETPDSMEELAFLSAVEYVNRNEMIEGSRLVPQVRVVSNQDSFQVINTVCELAEYGVVAVFGPRSSATSHHVQSLCDTLEIPHLTARWDPSQRRSSCLVNLHPHPTALSKAITDVVTGRNWKGFTVLYDDYDALLKVKGLLELADDRGHLIAVKQLVAHPLHGYRPILKELKYSEEKNIVLECSVDILYEVLIQAQQVGLMGVNYNYVVTSLDFQTINYEPFTYGGTNITTVRIINKDDPYVQEISQIWKEMAEYRRIYEVEYKVEAALIHDGVILLAKALDHLSLVSPGPVYCDQSMSFEFGYSVINFMRLSEFHGMSGLVRFDYEGFRTEFQLDVMELLEGGFEKKGVWNQTLEMIRPKPTEGHRGDSEDLRNTTFTVLIALTHPYNMLKEAREALKGNERYEGFGVDLIHELSLMSGFNYTLKAHTDKNSGNPTDYPNGTKIWNGLIGEVLAGRADLAIADITITREREMDVDFTDPFMNLGISILHRKPSTAPPRLFSFMAPFSSRVWAYMMSAYVGVSLLLFVMGRISPYEWTNPYPCVEEPSALVNQFSLNNAFWFTVGSLMQQGSDIAPIAVSTRMVASMWWFFTLIMVSSYTAQLASFLTIETIVQPFSDIEELANQNIIKYGAKHGGSTANFFRDSKDETYKKLYSSMDADPDCMMKSNEDGVSRVMMEKNYAFFMESTSIEYEVERKCDLAQVGGLLDHKGYGIVMRQNSTYRNILSRNVVKLQEKGKLTELKNKWWKQKRGGGACSSSDSNEAKKLTLDNTGGVFVVLLGGCVFSILVAFCEVLWSISKKESKVPFNKKLEEELKFIMQCRGTVKEVKKPGLSNSDSEEASTSNYMSKSSSFI